MANQRDRLEFLKAFERMLGNWTIAENRTKAISDEYYTVWQEVGADRFTRAVTAIIHAADLQFFPPVANFRGHVPVAKKHKFCGKCNTGFIMKPDYDARHTYNNETAMVAVPCECRGDGWRKRLTEKPTYQPEWEPTW